MIQADDIRKTFDPAAGEVLAGVSFSLERGSALSIIGPSGCGKTTLLYILAGLCAPDSGRLSLSGAGRTAFVLQDFGLFPWKTVAANVGLGLRMAGAPQKERRRIVSRLMAEMGLSGLEGRYPARLSGGQKQRVAIARALAVSPDLLLLDEPFSSLDALTREKLQDMLLDIRARRELTYALVTHSVEEAVFLGRRILVLTDRPARVAAVVENEAFGNADLRLKNCYFDTVREIRRICAKVLP